VKPLTVDGTVNTEYQLVDPWLLPKASNPALMQGAVDCLLADLEYQTEAEQAVRTRSQVGFMLICLNRQSEAIKVLEDCAHAQQLLQDYRGLIATELRLAQAFQASSDVAAALDAGQEALSRCFADPALADLQHFAHHHLGKVNLQAGLHDNARQHLQTALDLRQQTSNSELVASTQAALSLLPTHTARTDA
jgi:tetratricopeptide (TPR) repeat protein